MRAPPLRILVFGLPPMIADVISEALDAKDDITSTKLDGGDLEGAVASQRPDAVIVSLEDDRLPDESWRFLEERTRVRLIGIRTQDGGAVLYELRPKRSELGQASTDELADVLRKVVADEVRA